MLWVAIAFGSYLLSFEIKYLPGNLYMNVVMSTVADLISTFFATAQYERLGLKKSFYIGLLLSMAGCLMLLISEGYDSQAVHAICLFICKFGLTFTFMINYLSIVQLFPTLFSGTASGICNFVGRLATIGSPIIAELEAPIPMFMLATMLFLGLTSSTMLSIPNQEG